MADTPNLKLCLSAARFATVTILRGVRRTSHAPENDERSGMKRDARNEKPTKDRMHMKKKVIAGISLALLSALAHADDGDSVTLYGVLDVAVGTIEHSANGSGSFPSTINPVSKVGMGTPQSLTGMFNGGISDSRWGIRGNENLGGGWSAFFDLEQGFDVPSGEINNAAASIAGSKNTVAAASALSGQFFNRGAYVGLRNKDLGSIEFGRTPTLGLDTIGNYDPVFAAQLFSPLGFSGSYSAGGITEGSRTDNNIKYQNRIGNVNFGLSYSLGGVAGNFSAGSTYGANVGYEAGNFGVQAVYYSARDALHSGAIVGANAVGGAGIGTNVGALTLNDDQGFLLAARYGFGPLTLKGGYEHYELSPPSDPLGGADPTVGTSYFGYSGTTSNTGHSQVSNVYFFGGDYKLTPQLDFALGFYDTQAMQNANLAGGNQLQYSALADYHLSRRTDVYAGYMFSKFNGAEFNGFESTNYVAAAGLRTTF
jgi:GBP family porin